MNSIELERKKRELFFLSMAAQSFEPGSPVGIALKEKADEVRAQVNKAETDGKAVFQKKCTKCGAEPGVPCGHWEGRPVYCEGGR